MNPLKSRWGMYRNQSSFLAFAIVAALALGACQERAPTEASSRLLAASAVSLESNGRYVVVFSAERVPVDFGERVAALGGSIESAIDSIGVAGVTGLSEVAATELGAAADIRAVEPDPMTRPRDDGEAVDGLADERSEEHTSELQSRSDIVCRLLLEKKKRPDDETHAPRHRDHARRVLHQ